MLINMLCILIGCGYSYDTVVGLVDKGALNTQVAY